MARLLQVRSDVRPLRRIAETPASRTQEDRDLRKVARAKRKFLRHFPGGFYGEKYVDWERTYKWEAHLEWRRQLGEDTFRELLRTGGHDEIARRAVRIEGRTNLLFSFEKMAIRDAIRAPGGAEQLARGLFAFLHGPGAIEARFGELIATIGALPRKQTRVLTWPLLTVFGFIAQPKQHIFLKPNVTKIAAKVYGYPFEYGSKPSWATYQSLLDFARTIRRDVADLKPRDMIDLQSFIWVLGSDEYP